MGAWGEGVFQNDDALDFIGNLCDGQDLSIVADVLRHAAGVDELWKVEHVRDEALAAAEEVAAIGGLASPDLPPEARVWLSAHGVTLTPNLVADARAAARRVREWWETQRDYWSDPAHVPEYTNMMRYYWEIHGRSYDATPEGVHASFGPLFYNIDDLSERLQALQAQTIV